MNKQTESNPFDIIEHILIPLTNGRNLAARLWIPQGSEDSPVPAILEYLPYRKRDGTAQRDDSTYPGFARAGFAGVRVDISGTGESDGDYDDEYSPRELADGVEVIDWIAAQSWCNGSVGMMGISWGGFNSLQIAALQPAALKAVISIGSTVDRYNDDIHYKNGCQLYSNFSWSSVMLCFASRPPDPALVGESWREMWLHRLQTQPFPLETWLSHQRRDAYWQHGSVCEDYAAIKIPSMVISGWGDGYINAPPTMAANNAGLVHAINGPWIHKYPHIAYPGPRMDFLGVAINWWDRWLKGIDNGADDLPAYRAFIQENIRPGGWRENDPGQWVEEKSWPSEQIEQQLLYPAGDGRLGSVAEPSDLLTICSPQDCGTRCGEFFPLKPDAEMSGDQQADDAGSLCFDTDILDAPIQILGQPEVHLDIAIDKSLGNVAVRLVDLHPDGTGHRVSYGVLNLAHRHGNASPEPMHPGRRESVSIKLNHCGYRFIPGHRIRLSISTAYWPMIMPPPEAITASINPGDNTWLALPVRPIDAGIEVAEPAEQNPLPEYVSHQPAAYRRVVETDLHNRLTHFRVFDDTGESEIPGHGMRIRHTHEECWTVAPDDPLAATATSAYCCYMQRGNWRIKTESVSNLRCDRTHYYIDARVRAWEGEALVNERAWEKVIERDFT